MKKRILALTLIICLLTGGCGASSQPLVLRVAIPYSDFVQDPSTNYYIRWLEKKTGYRLEITVVRQTRTREYLDALFSSEADIDVIMFGADFTITEEELEPYAASGDVSTAGGRLYYENYGNRVPKRAGQILWINSEWLADLGLSAPKTVDELYMVLKSFKENDPNGNGENDEIALLGAIDDYCYMPVELILNSFVGCDPYHSYFDPLRQDAICVAEEDAFREGIKFCRRLYSEGFLDGKSFERSLSGLSELVNSPKDLVGAFSTDSISDVIYPGNPEIMARFVHVAPMSGPDGGRNAMYISDEPTVGAVITGRSTKKEAAAKLLETMMSEEGSLIARYGEEGVDWAFSEGKDVSIYGTVSTISTRNYIWNTSQNKNLNGIGPMQVPERYLAGVTWNGVNSDAEYIDARAQMSYRPYLPKESVLHEAVGELTEYVDRAIEDFVTGKKDPEDDRAWEDFLEGLHSFY